MTTLPSTTNTYQFRVTCQGVKHLTYYVLLYTSSLRLQQRNISLHPAQGQLTTDTLLRMTDCGFQPDTRSCVTVEGNLPAGSHFEVWFARSTYANALCGGYVMSHLLRYIFQTTYRILINCAKVKNVCSLFFGFSYCDSVCIFHSTNSCYMFAYLILSLAIIFTLLDEAYYKLLNSSLYNFSRLLLLSSS